MNKRIINAENRLERARENLKRVVEEVQLKCNHPSQFVHEAAWQPETHYVMSSPPFLVCLKCGLAEEKWGTGNKVLKQGKIKTEISRDEGMKQRRTMLYYNNDSKYEWLEKVRLFREETTVEIEEPIEEPEPQPEVVGFDRHGLEV